VKDEDVCNEQRAATAKQDTGETQAAGEKGGEPATSEGPRQIGDGGEQQVNKGRKQGNQQENRDIGQVRVVR
jgi:hypothetical protein